MLGVAVVLWSLGSVEGFGREKNNNLCSWLSFRSFEWEKKQTNPSACRSRVKKSWNRLISGPVSMYLFHLLLESQVFHSICWIGRNLLVGAVTSIKFLFQLMWFADYLYI